MRAPALRPDSSPQTADASKSYETPPPQSSLCQYAHADPRARPAQSSNHSRESPAHCAVRSSDRSSRPSTQARQAFECHTPPQTNAPYPDKPQPQQHSAPQQFRPLLRVATRPHSPSQPCSQSRSASTSAATASPPASPNRSPRESPAPVSHPCNSPDALQ